MKKTSHISRLFSTFFVCLMLMFTVFGKTFSVSQVHYSGVKKAKTEQSKKQKGATPECSVSELSVMHASPSISFDTVSDFVFSIPSVAIPVAVHALGQQLKVTSPNILYEILFEHFIATNAP
ncbi:hypothetical protein [Flectobacillus roseus]|uniref:Uncharacterized protein n=1 Tax=Flectobacillus roseus TaxID=502259 RepID=A0ABT6YD98_9BACT|nr:hypothetical protein [Flectobacillus roseus]MDI9861557.1 hypothetical protein [Flectobacillus roseus]